jgi:adsorption protein B
MADGADIPLAMVYGHLLLMEALLLVALAVAINGIDDLAIDALYLWWRRWPPPAPTLHWPPPPTRFAIIVPAWDESVVIGEMLGRLLARMDWPDYRVFVGLYANDPDGIAAVAAVADDRVVAVINPRPGPTTKADCLNQLWQAVQAEEAASGRPFAAIVLHDAEDVVDGRELALMAAALPGHAMVQLPVRPLTDPASLWVSGHYIDEFAESHAKDLLVRQWLGAALPSAGVGVAFDRVMLGRIADAGGGRPFAETSLTEDYELGHRIHALGGRALFLRWWGDGDLVATAEHFPAGFTDAVRQKARWLSGIALAGWDRLGWRGGMINRWMLMRDRKAPLMALVTLAAYGLVVALAIDGLVRQLVPMGAVLPPPQDPLLLALLWCNFILLCWRLVVRVCFTWASHGPAEAALAAPRAMVANLINAAAALRALGRYVGSLRHGRALAWDKTVHRFPIAGADQR